MVSPAWSCVSAGAAKYAPAAPPTSSGESGGLVGSDETDDSGLRSSCSSSPGPSGEDGQELFPSAAQIRPSSRPGFDDALKAPGGTWCSNGAEFERAS